MEISNIIRSRLLRSARVIACAKRVANVWWDADRRRQLVLANTKAADYLRKINMKKLTSERSPTLGEDKLEYFKLLREEANNGPIFSADVLKKVDRLRGRVQKQEASWIANTIMNGTEIDFSSVEEVFDWSRAHGNYLPVYEEAVERSKSWHRSLQEVKLEPDSTAHNNGYTTNNEVYKFSDGYSFVSVPEADAKREGVLMKHCVGGYCEYIREGTTVILSLRDSNNNPHVTVELGGLGQNVVQIKGKNNSDPISKKYAPYVREFLLKNEMFNGAGLQYLPDRLLLSLVEGATQSARVELATNTRSRVALEKLSMDEISEVRETVADNSYTTSSILSRLAGDVDTHVRQQVSIRTNTDEADLTRLASDTSAQVRRNVAKNKSTSKDTLDTLSTDSDNEVVMSVARNRSTRSSTLHRISIKNTYAQQDVVSNPSVNTETVEYVFTNNKHNKLFIKNLYDSAVPNPKTPSYILEEAFYASEGVTGGWFVQQGVLSNPSTSPSLISREYNKRDKYDNQTATNPSTPLHILYDLFSKRKNNKGVNKTRYLPYLLASNSSLPSRLLSALYEDAIAEDDIDTLYRIADNKNSEVKTLSTLALYDDVDVRSYVVTNPSFPLKLVVPMLNDRDQEVRLLASKRLSADS